MKYSERTSERTLEVAATAAAGIYLAFVAAIVWLTTVAVLAHYSPASAQTKPTQEKTWRVYTEEDGHRHSACIAERVFKDSVTVTIRSNTNGRYMLTLTGVSFNLYKEQLSFSLLQFDDEDPFELYARAVDTHITAVEPSLGKEERTRFLKQLGSARTLRVVVNDRFYELSLKDTRAVMTDLAACNANGQTKLNRKRVKTAQAAEITNG